MTLRPLLLAAALLASGGAPATAAPSPAATGVTSVEVSPQRILDMAELEVSFDTVRAEYYRKPNPQVLLDGARVGIVSYLRSRGIAAPVLAYPHATGVYAHDLHELDNEVYEAFRRYGSVIDLHAMVQRTITGELAALNDPYTVFFVPREYHEFVSSLSGRPIGGIGVIIDYKGGVALIDHVIAKSPAAQAGLRAGDRIVSVDGVALGTLDASAVADHLRGPVGSTARLEIVRDGATQAVPVVRAEVRQPDVDARMLAGNVGYIALAAYGEDSAHELNDALHELGDRGARAYILDLRDNGGGYARQAVAITSQFIGAGPVFTVQRRSGRRTTYDAEAGAKRHGPLAVLVNRNTASAAEITAAAIADDRAGTLVGERTFGKGVAQQVFVLPSGGAMKMTTERYFTAGGHDIDRKGIEPDVVVAEPAGAVRGVVGQDPQLDRALALLAPAAPSPSPSASP
jgi:carboxyl-terminal processing protease